MRSQILPPALCLMLAMLCCLSPNFSIAKNLHFETKVAHNNALPPILAMSPSIGLSTQNEPSINVQKSVSEDRQVTTLKDETSKAGPSVDIIYSDTDSITSAAINLENAGNDSLLFRRGMFYGFSLMIILLNFVCFFLFEEKVFLLFSLTLTALGATFLSIDSLFPLLGLNPIENMEAMHSTLFFIATACGALFASQYLSLEEFYPKMKWIGASLLGFALMMTISSWIVETAFYSAIANMICLSVLALYFLTGVALFSRKNYAKLYVISLGIPLLLSLDYFVLQRLGIDFLSTQNSHLKVATVVEMFLMTFAIVYRMRAIKEEHDMRQTEMRIFLKRQEVLNRTNTQKLMQDMYLENLIMQYDLDGFEIKLLQYISEGKDNSKIARKLKTTEPEIELQTKELYNKLEIGEQIKEDYQMVETQPDYIYN